MGLKVVPAGMQCFDLSYVDALKTLAELGIRQPNPAPGLERVGLMQNYDQVVRQMEAFGVKFKSTIYRCRSPRPSARPAGCRASGGTWLQLFRRRDGSERRGGRFGWYRHGGSFFRRLKSIKAR